MKIENETEYEVQNKPEEEGQKKYGPQALPIAIVIAGVLISGTMLYISQNPPDKIAAKNQKVATTKDPHVSALEESVTPEKGVTLPVSWGDLGAKMASVGVIDVEKLKAVYDGRGEFTEEYKNLLLGSNNGKLKITRENSGYLLNLFWALGLSSKNPILDSGEMTNKAYGGAGNFASTGGWTIAVGDSMDHYSRHKFFNLTAEQQSLVDKVSGGIYRPCCNNSTHFPDCNHGMAMLGLLELTASQGASEEDLWKIALAVNSYWFPDMYITMAFYMKDKGIEWKNVNPREILGIDYSSASSYAKIASKVALPESSPGGSGCAVDSGQVADAPKQQSDCDL
ncbi:MAG: hypothetical protein Q7S34_02035 [bacterium]|nr:hypothetical protein [bacterium]